MTAQKNQIQALIAEIDGILGKASPNLPWVMSRDAAEQRQLLGRIRGYLLSLQKAGFDQSAFQSNPSQRLVGYDIHTPASSLPSSPVPGDSIHQEAAQQILQAVVQEMGYLRANVTQPLQAELEALRLQREALLQEVRQLEAQRQQHQLLQQQANQQQMLSEFLQVLMGRLQENLSQQIAQSLGNGAQTLPYSAGYGAALGAESAYSAALSPEFAANSSLPPGAPQLNPAQRLDQIQHLQAQSDQMLMSLDSSLGIVFETLQRNIQSYQDSLSQGIEKMHSLGYQGEVMFTALVNHLAQQLGREASSFLQAAAPASLSPTPAAPLPPITPTIDNLAGTAGSAFQVGLTPAERLAFQLPYPGSELPLSSPSPEAKQPKGGPGPDSTSLKDLDLEDLDLSDLNLNEPDLSLLDGPQLDTLLDLELNGDQPATQLQASTAGVEPSPITSLELTDLPLLAETTDLSSLAANLPAGTTELENPEALDSALEFLDQLSAALEEHPTQTVVEAGESPEPAEPVEAASGLEVDERIYEELDDFYASLFGDESAAAVGAKDALNSPVVEADLAEPDSDHLAPSLEENSAELPLELSPTSELTELEPSLENFFFGEASLSSEVPSPEPEAAIAPPPEAADLPLDLTSLFGEPVQPAEITPPPEAADTLELLSSLLSEETTGPAAQAARPMVPSPAPPSPSPEDAVAESAPLEFGEDSYIPAAPEENLLDSDFNESESELDLSINATTLQQLSEDLSSLEGLENLDFQELQMVFPPPAESAVSPTPAPEIPAEPSESTGWEDLTLNDFSETLPLIAPPSLPEPGESQQPETPGTPTDEAPFTLEHMDDLFGDLPSAPNEETRPAVTPPQASSVASPVANKADEVPLTLDDAFADFFGTESSVEQKKKSP